jgi:hypothetical protein
MRRLIQRPYFAVSLLVLTGAVFLAVVTWLAEFAELPAAVEAVVRVVYRPVYLMMVPFHYASRFIEFPADRHWPVWQLPAVSLVTSVMYTGLGLFLLRLWRWFTRSPHGADTVDFKRRQFLVRASSGTAALAGAATVTHASLIAPTQIHVRRYEAPVADLPEAFDGLRIAHVSDTHLGPFISLAYLQRMVREVNALRPDLVALTGDYTHRSPRTIGPGIGVFQGLMPRFGSVAVLGNHDHWEGAAACRARFEEIGIPILDNTRLFLTPRGLRDAPQDGGICLAGLGDLWEDATAFDRALDGVGGRVPRIMLAHNPDSAEEDANGRRMDLMLSGHTHGGQIAIPGRGAIALPSHYGIKYAGGWVEGPQCSVVISRGVGMTVMPVRFGVPPEVGLITLRRASEV